MTNSNDFELALENLEQRTLLSTVQIFASGSMGDEAFDVLVAGERQASFELNGTEESVFEFSDAADIRASQIKIQFTNDSYDPANGIDRNLKIDKIIIDGQTYETEAASTFSTGSWKAGDGIVAGFRQSEYLDAEGYFQFDANGNSGSGDGSTVEMSVRGEEGTEQFFLIIKGENVGIFSASNEFELLSYTHDTEVTADDVRIEFINDAWDPANGIDSNLTVDFVTIDGTVYETEDAAVYSTGSWKAEDGIAPGFGRSDTLNTNGYFQYAAEGAEEPGGGDPGGGDPGGGDPGEADGSEILVRARGDEGSEQFNLILAGQSVGTFDATTEFQTIAYTHTGEISGKDVRVEFINDQWDPANGIDSNLTVDFVSVDGIVYQTEDLSVFSTGVWKPEDGIAPGFRESETLNTNGYFQYADNDVVEEQNGVIAVDVTSITVGESNSTVAVNLVRSDGSDGAVTVDFATADGTAIAGEDYIASSGTLTFADGETTKTILISLLDDTSVESAEDFTVTLSNPTGGATLNTTTQKITLTDNDEVVTNPEAGEISFNATSRNVDENVGIVIATLIREGGSDGRVSVDYETVSGTAKSGQDFASSSGTIVFEDGETEKQIAVTVLNSTATEETENFTIQLSNSTGGAAIGSADTLTLTVFDDDAPTPTDEIRDVEGDGEWGTVKDWTLMPLHSIVLPDGKVLAFGTDSNGVQGGNFIYGLWDPETDELKVLENTTGVNIFCSNMAIDPNTGNVIIMGGDRYRYGGAQWTGITDVVVFDYRTQTIRNSEVGDLNFARWYGSVTTLSNGEILMVGGRDASYDGSTIPEIYNHETGFRTLPGAEITDFYDDDGSLRGTYWYTHVWQASDGDVWVIESEGGGGSRSDMHRVDISGNGSVETVGKVPFDTRNLNPGVMFDVDKVAIAANDGWVWVGDLSADVPTWERAIQMTDHDSPSTGIARTNGHFVPLPDGRVAFVGGSDDAGLLGDSLALAQLDIVFWDPQTNEVETGLARQQLARMYHSAASLLPDGRIWVGGGGAPGPLENLNAEVFTPHYLFGEDGRLVDRPEVLYAPRNIDAGDTFEIIVDDTSNIEKVTVVRSGASTHARNNDARFVSLDFTIVDDNTIRVSTPSLNVMPRGLWLLSAVDADGVASESSLLGVNMAVLEDSGDLDPGPTIIYGISDEQINGAFEVKVEARFDDAAAGNNQRVFDFGDAGNQNNIWLGQVGSSNDLAFTVMRNGVQSQIVASNVIESGVIHEFRVAVDETGLMTLKKDGFVVASGQGEVPADVDRTSNFIGESNFDGSTQLDGMVRHLDIMNAGDAVTGPEMNRPVMIDVELSTLTGQVTELANDNPNAGIADLSTSGSIRFFDMDEKNTHTATLTPLGNDFRGSFAIGQPTTTTNATHGYVDWTFTINDDDLNDLTDSESINQSYQVTIDDGNGKSRSTTITVTLIGSEDVNDGEPTIINSLDVSYADDFITLDDNTQLVNGAYFSAGTNSLIAGDYFTLQSGGLNFDGSTGSSTLEMGTGSNLNGGDIYMSSYGKENSVKIGSYTSFSYITMNGGGANATQQLTIGRNSASDAGITMNGAGNYSDRMAIDLNVGDGTDIGGTIYMDGSYTEAKINFGDNNKVRGDIYLRGYENANEFSAGLNFFGGDDLYGSYSGTDNVQLGDDWTIVGTIDLNGGDDILELGLTSKDTGGTIDGDIGNDTLRLKVRAADVTAFEAEAIDAGWETNSDGSWNAKSRTLNWQGQSFRRWERVELIVV